MSIHYEDERVTLHHADCLDVLRSMPDCSVDSVVTDPPYGLSNTDPRHVTEAITRWCAGDREFVPDGAGFMGAKWDAFVPPPAVWDECLRVLKPGGHALVFSSSRTTDLMTLSLRLAGFEIRDSIAWLYGGAMPKSLDVGKAIDKTRDDRDCILAVTTFMADVADRAGVTRADVDEHMGTSDMGGWWLSRIRHRCQVPKWDQWLRLKELIGFPDDMDAEVWRLNGRKGTPGEAWGLREVVGVRTTGIGTGDGPVAIMGDSGNYDITAPATDAARQWQGWGTGLRPSMELVCVARKPIEGTVAACVQKYGTGAINIDATRISAGQDYYDKCGSVVGLGSNRDGTTYGEWTAPREDSSSPSGRWPANVVLDDTTAAQLDEETGDTTSDPRVGQFGVVREGYREQDGCVYSNSAGRPPGLSKPGKSVFGYGDAGGPSRYFPVFKYQAKAPQRERPSYTDDTGRKIAHSTVKPLGFMKWLVRLVTQPGGLILDPFAGSGSTLEAAMLEGFRSIGVEQSAEYLPLIMIRVERANAADTGLFTAPASKGRWPANVAMDRDTAAALDEESGISTSPTGPISGGYTHGGIMGGTKASLGRRMIDSGYGDTGGASRYFPVFDTDEPDALFEVS